MRVAVCPSLSLTRAQTELTKMFYIFECRAHDARDTVSLIYVCITVTHTHAHTELVRMKRMKKSTEKWKKWVDDFYQFITCACGVRCVRTWRHNGVWLRCVHRLTIVNACCEFAESDRSREPSRRFFSIIILILWRVWYYCEHWHVSIFTFACRFDRRMHSWWIQF